MSQHTPGPWEHVQEEDQHWRVDARGRNSTTRRTICYLTDSARTPQEDDADARLIAKAPELEALLRILVFPGGGRDHHQAILKSRALLREIEGP